METMAMPTSGSAPPLGGLNINPTGANSTGGTTPTWMPPPTGSPGNYGYGSSGNPNPISMNPNTGGTTTPVTGGIGAGSATNSQLNSPLGTGLGPQVQTFLNSNGGYNSPLTQQAVATQAAEMGLQANVGAGNLASGLGAAGVGPNSSASALENSNYWSNVTTAENAMTAQEFFNMWQSSMGNETSVLEAAMGPSAAMQQMQYTSPMDWANFAIGAATDVASLGTSGAFSGMFGGGGSGGGAVGGGSPMTDTSGAYGG